ncbi:hypothetical protein [Actinoplanes italicus]|nr:hypothetical protein [Actinoplanes italicus]
MRADVAMARLERALVPYYWLAAVFGVLCFIANVTLNDGAGRLIALVWVVLIPLWTMRYIRYRRTRRGDGSEG